MPRGYGSRQIYFRADEGDLLQFWDSLEHPSAWVKQAMWLKRATEGDMPVWLPIVRREVQNAVRQALQGLGTIVLPGSGNGGKEELDENGELGQFMSNVDLGG